ncbi:hypothetical protein SLS61_004485 [Didymella pomorum]
MILGEYIEDRGYEYFPHLSLPSPRLSTENESGDERDEARTPPDTPSMARVSKCETAVEEYNPTTFTIDLLAQNIKSMEREMAHDFVNFSSIAEELTADQILGDAGQRMLNAEINEEAPRLLVSNVKARTALKLTTVTAEATISASTPADEVDSMIAPADSDIITQVATPATREPSPGMAYIVDPIDTSSVWNTVAAGWFALSSLPWGRMTVAAVGVLVDVAVFITRH